MEVPKRKKTGAPPKVYPSAVVDRNANVGADTAIGAFCYVAAGARIGAGTRIQSHTAVWNGVTLEEDVFVGPSATFTNVRHPRADFLRAPHWDETVVESGATIGANSVLVAPVRIGARAVVAAGAVVTKNVAAHAIVAGSPARVIGWACTCGETITQSKTPPAKASCAHCKRRYAKKRDGLIEMPAPLSAGPPRAKRSPKRK